MNIDVYNFPVYYDHTQNNYENSCNIQKALMGFPFILFSHVHWFYFLFLF